VGVNVSFECVLVGVELFVVDTILGTIPVEGGRLEENILASTDGGGVVTNGDSIRLFNTRSEFFLCLGNFFGFDDILF
jgi:hypothetical protein